MRQKDLNRINMWKAVASILQQHADVWAGNIAFSAAEQSLRRCIDAADKALQAQSGAAIKGITADKNALAEAAIDQTLSVSKLARAYARRQQDHVLFAAVDYDRGELQNTPLDELPGRLQGILDAVVAVKADLADYGFATAADTQAQQAIDAFHSAQPATRAAIAGRAATTASVPGLIKEGKQELLILDDLVHLYEESAPHFVQTYKAARTIVDAGRSAQKAKEAGE